MTDRPNDPLADGVRRHDPAAVAAFLEQRRPALRAFVERRLGAALRSKIEPDDVLQELAVRAVRDLPQTDFTTLDPFNWLCHLAEQCIIDGHRHFAAGKRASGREVPGNVKPEDGSQDLIALLSASLTSPSQAAVRDERQDRLAAVLATFPDDHREALRLRYAEGLPSKEVAKRLGKTDVAVRVLLARLVRKLQELLEPGETPRPPVAPPE